MVKSKMGIENFNERIMAIIRNMQHENCGKMQTIGGFDSIIINEKAFGV